MKHFVALFSVLFFFGCDTQTNPDTTPPKKPDVTVESRDITPETAVLSTPTKREQKEIVNQTTRQFFQDVKKKNFQTSYENTAPLFQEQFSQDLFTQNFQSFFQQEFSQFEYIENTDPTFTKETKLTEQNGVPVLSLEGVYTAPNDDVVAFTLQYIYQNSQWQVFDMAYDFRTHAGDE